ncbi:hypothetical protein N8I74_10955 [Chitiniphilus purpureus]|uniref:Uncharacterized protein n=1 Tax=Chitiniphilus purpureus TaxID=2981137 RepID=A0ABY6DK69_9NEIS|nr:hypothetical protein [Chitiniphilus sp. CD1]UXY13841.1 hypothetical protein N8I74_10955 [Chitiniphilus sp. CD1]
MNFAERLLASLHPEQPALSGLFVGHRNRLVGAGLGVLPIVTGSGSFCSDNLGRFTIDNGTGMNNDSLEVLNIVQQVLRQFMLAVAAGNQSNLGDIGDVLEAAAARESLDPMARRMLADLASGAHGLHAAGIAKKQ